MTLLNCETVLTHPTPDAAIIWLHGLGASGHDFVPIVPELALPVNAKIRFVFPHAPHRPVTINGGVVMPAWYDILELSIERKIDHDSILTSAHAIQALVQREINNGISSKRIILAGFSQGGAVAYEAGLSFDQPLGGLIILSSYFATQKTIAIHTANQSLPIHLSHGTMDTIVPPVLAQHAFDDLSQRGFTPAFHRYPVDHSLHPQQVKDLSTWIQNILL